MKKHSTKKALVASILALAMCFSMLIGTTFAWFTDSVSSNNNIIQTGNLDVAMYWAEGGKDVPAVGDAAWADASTGAMFNHGNWEPGYAQARHILIANKGTLALNYRLRIVANGAISKLANVIDVYYVKDATSAATPDALGTKIGTLTDVLGTTLNLSNSINGSLTAGQTATWTLVLKMQETADNDYQEMDLGCTFSVELIATQMAFEKDSFGPNYDGNSTVSLPEIPAALVRPLDELQISTNGPLNSTVGGIDLSQFGVDELDVGYRFEPTASFEDALSSDYRYWHADFVVKADRDVPANSMALAGYYDAWCQYNDDKWIALTSPSTVTAGTELRLVGSMGGGSITVNWEDLCEYGNDGKGFQCGAVDLTGANAGTTITVELRMYETPTKGACANGGGCTHPTAACEVGETAYKTIGTFTYTFGYPTEEITTVTNDAELAQAITDGKTNIALANGTYHMPAVAQGKIFTVSSASGNAEDVIIEVVPGGQSEANGQLDYSLDGSNVCFNKVTIKTNSQLYAGYARLEATYNNCIIQNTFNLATGKAVFNSCEINITNEYLRVGGASKAVFDECTFNTDGRAILVFQDGTSVSQEVIVKDCTFNATAAAQTWNGIHVAAVSYDGSQGGTYTVTFEGNNVVDSDFNGLWQIKAGEANVTVNGLS